jgi:terminase large subunit-like protein
MFKMIFYPFIKSLAHKFEAMITNVTEALLEKKQDLSDRKVQSQYRLACQLTNTYLRITAKLSKESNKESKTESKIDLEVPQAWRDDPVEFASEALNIELYEHQQKFCRSTKRVNLMIAGRGAGKSIAACVAAIFYAVTNPHHIALVVSSGQRMSSDFGARIIELIRESSVNRWIKSISNEQVAFKNGSTIKLLPANPDTIRGYHPKTNGKNSGISVFLDEACFMEQGNSVRKAVEYAMITSSSKKGKLYIVSSPSSTGSWVYDYVSLARKNDKHTALIECPSNANPTITDEEVERLRQSKNGLEFRAEVLGEWVDGAYGMFTGLIEPNIIPAYQDKIPKEASCSLGVDLALSYDQTHDRNALAVVARWWPDEDIDSEAKFRLVDMKILERASDREIRRTASRLIEKYGIDYAGVENYQGKGIAEYCESLKLSTELISPTASAQKTAFHELHRLLRQELLELPDNLPKIFFEELKTFEYRRKPNGQTTFGHPSGKHDDTIYALAWAIYAIQFGPEKTPIYDAPPLIMFSKKW